MRCRQLRRPNDAGRSGNTAASPGSQARRRTARRRRLGSRSKVEEQIVKTEEPPPPTTPPPPTPEVVQAHEQPQQVAMAVRTEFRRGAKKGGTTRRARTNTSASCVKSCKRPKSIRARDWLGTVWVKFRVGPAGELLSREITSSSGSKVLDQAAVAALDRAAPFPPMPDEVARGRWSSRCRSSSSRAEAWRIGWPLRLKNAPVTLRRHARQTFGCLSNSVAAATLRGTGRQPSNTFEHCSICHFRHLKQRVAHPSDGLLMQISHRQKSIITTHNARFGAAINLRLGPKPYRSIVRILTFTLAGPCSTAPLATRNRIR